MNNPQVIDVLVVGAGPSGSAVAIDLVRRGHVVRIIDRSPHAFDGSRAKGVQPRSLEVLEDLGALKDVLAGGSVYPKLGIHAGPFAVPWKMFPRKEATPDVPLSGHLVDPSVPHGQRPARPARRARVRDRVRS